MLQVKTLILLHKMCNWIFELLSYKFSIIEYYFMDMY